MSGEWMRIDRFRAPAPNEIQLWRVELGKSEDLLDGAYEVLTREERERAGRMRAGVPRDEFVAGRGSLRRLLGAVVSADPTTLTLETGAHGKPRLRREAGRPEMWFNVAHSHGVILIGLSLEGEIGVDVEYRDSGVEVEDVARTVFHDDELVEIEKAGAPESKIAAFYCCWTRKEAVVKADGRGLTMEPTLFAVGQARGSEVEVALPPSLGGQSYFVNEVDAGQLYSAAVAGTKRGLRVQCLEYPPSFL
jgi:4'-phosphopantetheinyl transferase